VATNNCPASVVVLARTCSTALACSNGSRPAMLRLAHFAGIRSTTGSGFGFLDY